jgi:methyl-accepting chemotaxis protein
MINQIFVYFMPKGQLGYFETQKSKAAIIMALIGLVVVTFQVVQTILMPTESYLISLLSSTALGVFILVILFVLKYQGIKITGNILSLGLIVLLLLAMNALDKDVSALYKYIQGFYTVLGLMTVSFLFASQWVIIINAILVLASTFRVYFFAQGQIPENAELIKAGIINHTIAVVILTLVGFFIVGFSKNAIDAANKEAIDKEKQNEHLSQIISIIEKIVQPLKKLTNELLNLANNVSQNSTHQAANVEEISATIEEITSSIIESTGNTQSTAQTVNNTAEFTRKSEHIISNSLEAIRNIDARIGLIQVIAFQTNILSLNAAIEAARAGQAGRGFSVVAGEVKKLAEHSDKGASEIIKLVKNAISGSDEAGNYLKNITTDIKTIKELIDKIANAALEQKGSMEQINQSVAQINTGAQQNALLSERLADAVRQISVHTDKLTQILNAG